MRAKYAPTGQHMMLNINTFSSIFVSLSLYTSGEPIEFWSFATRHPEVLLHMGSLGLAGALGQLFIFRMISAFGSLSNSLVTTTRKFFTVLFSVLFFGNSLSGKQWLGTIMVFSGLFADMLYKKLPSANPQKVNKV
jgi:UDP-galactose transporter B1